MAEFAKHSRTFGAFALGMCALALSTAAPAAHDRCGVCHIGDAPQPQQAALSAPLPGLCVDCHRERMGKREHVVGVPPSAPVTADLPLLNGLISCTTCHDPHGTGPGMLRLPTDALCRACHKR